MECLQKIKIEIKIIHATIIILKKKKDPDKKNSHSATGVKTPHNSH